MKKSILIVFLAACSFMFSGCSLVSPFKSINTCENANEGGAACATIESNLEYSISSDNKAENKEESKKENINDNKTIASAHSDKGVEKDELIRLITMMNINVGLSQEPVLIPPTSYKVVIIPYSDSKKFYSGRNIYIVAGKPRWVAGNFLMSKEKYKISDTMPNQKAEKVSANFSKDEKAANNESVQNQKKTDDIIIVDVNAEQRKKVTQKNEPIIKHKVSAYLLNCRDTPSIKGNSIAVFEKDQVLIIMDKSLTWWKINYQDIECYVNSSYLYSEPES